MNSHLNEGRLTKSEILKRFPESGRLQRARGLGRGKRVEKPIPTDYQDYRLYFRDLFEHFRALDQNFTPSHLCKKAGVREDFFELLFTLQATFSRTTLGKLLPFLGLSVKERKYLTLLRDVAELESSDERWNAYQQMLKLRVELTKGQEKAPAWAAQDYLSHWYIVAIREMTLLPDFTLDPNWIQGQLLYPVSVEDIQSALKFLQEHRFIELDFLGRPKASRGHMECTGGAYRLSLEGFHEQMFSLAADSIKKTPRHNRKIAAHTVAIPIQKIEEIKAIIQNACSQIVAIANESQNPDTVYHLEMALFPLSVPKERRVRYGR